MPHFGRCNTLHWFRGSTGRHDRYTLSLVPLRRKIISWLAAIARIIHRLHVQVVVSFVSPKVFWTWKPLTEKTQHRKHSVAGNLLINFLELVLINMDKITEAHFKNSVHFFHGFYSLIEIVQASTFLREFALSICLISSSKINDW